MFRRLAQWDQQSFFLIFNRSNSKLLLQASYWISKTADGPLYIIVLYSLWLFQWREFDYLCTLIAIAFSIELPLYILLKNGIKRSRPAASMAGSVRAHIIPSDTFSLPSGHTAGAFVVAIAISLVMPAATFIVLFWALLVGLSRVMLGVHFPLDILAGALLGITATLVAYQIVF